MKADLINPYTGRPFYDQDGVLCLDAILVTDPDRIEKMRTLGALLRKAQEHPEIVALTRNKYYAGVRPAAVTAATARAAASVCWNPHATSRIQAFEVWLANTSAVAFNLGLTRATARGTASTTSTPAAGNAIENDSAPPSGFVIDTAWSVAPTISAVDMIRWNVPAAAGNGVFLPFPDPIAISPVSGLALITPTALAFQVSDITWVIGD